MKLLSCCLTIVLILPSYAQEHLTCLRSSTPSSGSSATIDDTNRGRQQGPPGKVGPIGQKGDSGIKGEKGEAGVPDDSVVDPLREEISSLQQQFRKTVSALQGRYKLLDDGWVGLYNDYQYKITPNRQNYENSKIACSDMGASLAVYGMQDILAIRLLARALDFGSRTWFGLNDIVTEGEWIWENGVPTTEINAPWRSGSPNRGASYDCAAAFKSGLYLMSDDQRCPTSYEALCEKPWKN